MQAADPSQPPKDVGHIASEHASIDMHIVDDDIAQVSEEIRPTIMLGEDPQVQHVGIGEDDLRPFSNRTALRGRRIAVVGAAREVGQPELRERVGLILSQSLGWKEVQGTSVRIC